jgi:hypothetical protein
LATVSGVFAAYPNACLIWVDAHAVSELDWLSLCFWTVSDF